MHLLRFRLSRLVLCFVVATALRAQPAGYGVALSLTPFGTFDTNHPDWRPAEDRLLVRGTFSLPFGVPDTDFQVRVQGQATTHTLVSAGAPGGSPATYSFQFPIPVGPTTPTGGWGVFAYGNLLRQPAHIAKPMVAELVKNGTNEVYARHMVALFDKRYDAALNPQSTVSTVSNSLGMELTGNGLNNLEALHRSTLPQPSKPAFDSVLTSNFRNFNKTKTMGTEFFDFDIPTNTKPKACVPVNSIPDAFRQTTGWDNVRNEAKAVYDSYLAAKALQDNGGNIASVVGLGFPPALLLAIALQGGASATIAATCVHSPPQPSDFELCAGSIRGDAQTLAMAGVTSTDLALGAAGDAPPTLSALNRVGRLDSTVDGKLLNFFFRYKSRELSGCTLRPRAALPESEVASNVTRHNWRMCPAMELDVLSAVNTSVIRYQLNGDADKERNRPEVLSSPTPLFELGQNVEKNTAFGACTANGFAHHASALLDEFIPRIKSALNSSWAKDSPRTQQANGLDLIFSRWETGIFGDANLAGTPTGADLQYTHEYKPLASLNQSDRFFTVFDTQAKALPSVASPSWLFASHGAYPCRDNLLPCLTGATYFNQPFDTSFSVTTNALNAVIKEQGQKQLSIVWQPTYAEIGITPPPGSQPGDLAVLNGPNLSQLHGSFGMLGNNVATIRLIPQMMPYLYMDPDPPNTAVGRTPLTYQTTMLRMELETENAISPLGDHTWLSINIHHFDPEFVLSPGQPHTNVLSPTFSSLKGFQGTVVRNAFHSSGCPMGLVLPPPPQQPPAPYPTCANVLGSRLVQPFIPLLETKLLYMLSRFPAPLRWDAAGQGGPLNWSPVDQFQSQNVITFYGRIQ